MSRRLALVALLLAAPARGDVLTATDFNTPGAWPQAAAVGGEDVAVTLVRGPVGTIDERGGKTPSGGLHLLVAPSPAGGLGTASLVSGPLAVANHETELGHLTLAFTLSVSLPQPVTVRMESLAADDRPTGTLERLVLPAAADFPQRYALDLDTFQPSGAGRFQPTDPSVRLTVSVPRNSAAGGWPTRVALDLRLDNVSYAGPSYYVGPAGSDAADGRTPATAFATPQKAVSVAKPGDIIVLLAGTYGRPKDAKPGTPVVDFVRPGTPAGWIVLRGAKGQRPVLMADGQQAVRVVGSGDPLGYLEVRGLTVRGNGDTARERFPQKLGTHDPEVETRGFYVNGKESKAGMVHHLRLADAVVEYCTSDGVYLDAVDWCQVENCDIRNNCWTGINYAPAGLAVMHHANFDAADNVAKFLIAGNRVAGNRLTVPNSPWNKPEKIRLYNGNGILLDANAEKPPDVYLGRTLVQNNRVWDNGGGGIQTWGNHRMDIAHNTLVRNGTQPERWGQLGLDMTRDVRVVNNLIVAQPDGSLDTWRVNRPDRPAKIDAAPFRIERAHNLFFGGAGPPVHGTGTRFADPLFADPAAGDFRLKPGSPAVRAGAWELFLPAGDAAGHPRPAGGPPDLGALQQGPA